MARRVLHVRQRVPDRPGDLLGRGGDRVRARQDDRRRNSALRLVRRGGGEPAGRPVHRPATGRRGRLAPAERRRAERVRRGRRPREHPAHRRRPRLRPAPVELPRRLVEPAGVDLRQ